jgi:putative intracellular protease/amidase
MRMTLTRRRFGIAALGLGGLGLGAYGWRAATATHVAVLIGPGVRPLDAVGPMEVLGRLPNARGSYVSPGGGNVAVASGPLVIEQTRVASQARLPDVLLIAGGTQTPDAATLAWIARAASRAQTIFAVGAGRQWLEMAMLSSPSARIVRSDGGAAAIDAALTIAAGLAGRAHAEALQLGIEYDPHPPFPVLATAVAVPDVAPLKVAILLYEGMTALDAIGPYEVFSRLPGAVITLFGPRKGTMNSDTGDLFMGMPHGLDDLGPQDLLIIPGGSYGTLQAAKDQRLTGWLARQVAAKQRIVSVCTGALILAETGALRGKTATTHWASANALNASGAHFVHARYVEHGNIVTAAGVSAGIDVALKIVGELRGEAAAQAIQAALPYVPRPPFSSGAMEKATQAVIADARAELRNNALGSIVRMNKRRLVGQL